MLTDVDYFFVYKHLVRFILLHKTNAFRNTMEVPFLRSLVLFISLANVEYLEDSYFFNFIYLFRFFYGNRSFFSKFKSAFSLGRTYHSFTIQSFFFKRYSFFPILFLVNDVLALTSRFNYHFFFKDPGVFLLQFFDMNLFLEKKTNVGLFNLSGVLHYKFFFSLRNFKFYNLFLDSLKFYAV